MSKTTGFQTERTKPFPITSLDFSDNDITGEGIGQVVQFARTQGSDATSIDLSKNRLDDAAATDEVTRLVKNYSSFAANAFISTLVLSGNDIGKAGTPPTHAPSHAACAALACPRRARARRRAPHARCPPPRVRRRAEADPVRPLGARPLQE